MLNLFFKPSTYLIRLEKKRSLKETSLQGKESFCFANKNEEKKITFFFETENNGLPIEKLEKHYILTSPFPFPSEFLKA